jgi:hypothetical protein
VKPCHTLGAIHLVLFGKQNRTPGPDTAAMHRILISAMCWRRRPGGNCDITETNGTRLALFGMQNRTLGPYSAAMHRIPVSVMVRAA